MTQSGAGFWVIYRTINFVLSLVCVFRAAGFAEKGEYSRATYLMVWALVFMNAYQWGGFEIPRVG